MFVSEVWDKHYGERCVGVTWDLFTEKDELTVSDRVCRDLILMFGVALIEEKFFFTVESGVCIGWKPPQFDLW